MFIVPTNINQSSWFVRFKYKPTSFEFSKPFKGFVILHYKNIGKKVNASMMCEDLLKKYVRY